jgi:hypothetical protein
LEEKNTHRMQFQIYFSLHAHRTNLYYTFL